MMQPGSTFFVEVAPEHQNPQRGTAKCYLDRLSDQPLARYSGVFDATIKGSDPLQLVQNAKLHQIDVLAVSSRHQIVLGGEGGILSSLFRDGRKVALCGY